MTSLLSGVVGLRRLVPAFVLVALFLFPVGCGTKKAPWVEYGPPRAEERLQALAVALIMSIEDQWGSGVPFHAICVGVGRRVQTGLRSAARAEDWDPSGFFFRTLGDQGLPAYPLSACGWGEYVEERVVETGARAVALGASNVNWITARTASIVVWIRESPQYTHSYECEFDRPDSEWRPVRCLFRFR